MAPKKDKTAKETTAAAERPRRAIRKPDYLDEPDAPAPKRAKPAAKPAKSTKRAKDETEAADVKEPPKKRGKPPKAPAPATETEGVEDLAEPATKDATQKDALTEIQTVPRRKRKSGPEGGQTLKLLADEGAAADQLEDELLDTAAEAEAKAGTGTKGKKLTGQGKKQHASSSSSSKRRAERNDDGAATRAKAAIKRSRSSALPAIAANPNGETGGEGGRQYWLMKAEQEDREEKAHDGTIINTKFTIDDLRSKTSPELWDGVRNHVAANNMRAMRTGDLAFFYASGGKQGRSPGITGIMEVVSEAEPDPTTTDPSAYGYVEKAADRQRWVVVGVEFRRKLATPVSLKQLQEYRDGALAGMQLFRQARLSVARVEKAEWEFVCGLVRENEE